MTPELPDDPEAEQVQAWAELAELSQDSDVRASLRRMARDEAAERGQDNTPVLRRHIVSVVRDQGVLGMSIGPCTQNRYSAR